MIIKARHLEENLIVPEYRTLDPDAQGIAQERARIIDLFLDEAEARPDIRETLIWVSQRVAEG